MTIYTDVSLDDRYGLAGYAVVANINGEVNVTSGVFTCVEGSSVAECKVISRALEIYPCASKVITDDQTAPDKFPGHNISWRKRRSSDYLKVADSFARHAMRSLRYELLGGDSRVLDSREHIKAVSPLEFSVGFDRKMNSQVILDTWVWFD